MEKLTFTMDDGNTVSFYILEETRINGIDYILVTDSSDEEEEAQAYILRDTSQSGEEEASFEFVEDETELETVGKIFAELLDDHAEITIDGPEEDNE